MTRFDRRANWLRWRLRATQRLWRPGVTPEMPFLLLRTAGNAGIGQIDHPLSGDRVSGETLAISGWVGFDSGPTSRVEVWLGESLLGRARLGLPRPDVGKMAALPRAAVSGFELTADIGQVFAGGDSPARLRVVATAANGETLELPPVSVLAGEDHSTDEETSPPAPVPARAERGGGLRTMVVTHQLNLGGAQLYLMDLLRGLLDRGGIEPTVVSAMDGPLRQELEELGIPVHLTSMLPAEDLGAHLGRVEEWVAWAQPHDFQLAFINTATAFTYPGAEVADRLGIPAVWAIHESFEPAILWGGLDQEVRALAEAALGNAAYAIFEAEATQRIFEPLIDESRCRMLPYGLDLTPIDARRNGFDAPAERREVGLPADSRVVLCVGTVEPRKAQIPLAQAFDLIAGRHPDANLVFVGGRKNDPQTEALEGCIAESKYNGQMRLIQITPDVERWYGMADLLVCASDVESLPRTVLEAMAWETPVLATSVFGLPELITEGEDGWLCEPRDLRALADALDRALSSSLAEQKRIGAAARALIEKRHALDVYSREVAGLLEQAVADDAGPSNRHATTA